VSPEKISDSLLSVSSSFIIIYIYRKTWRSVFYVTAGISALIFIGGLLTIDPDQPSTEEDKRVDWFGSFLITAALTLIIFVLCDGSIAPNGWRTSCALSFTLGRSKESCLLTFFSSFPFFVQHVDIIACLVVGVVLVALFFVWQGYLGRAQDRGSTSKWHPPPLVRNEIWFRASGRFTSIQLIVLFTWCSFLSNNFWVRFLLSQTVD
jgi:hypothetical protein